MIHNTLCLYLLSLREELFEEPDHPSCLYIGLVLLCRVVNDIGPSCALRVPSLWTKGSFGTLWFLE